MPDVRARSRIVEVDYSSLRCSRSPPCGFGRLFAPLRARCERYSVQLRCSSGHIGRIALLYKLVE